MSKLQLQFNCFPVLALLLSTMSVSSTAYAMAPQHMIISSMDVTAVRAHSVQHPLPDVHKMVLLHVRSLAGGCESLFYYGDADSFVHATVLSMINTEKPQEVELFYDSEGRNTIVTNSCRLHAISIHKVIN